MKNRSTIQTLTFVQTNPDHLYMKLNMKLVVLHAIIHSFGSKKLAPCKNFSWLLHWLLTFKTGTWKWRLAIFLAPTFWEPEQPLNLVPREIVSNWYNSGHQLARLSIHCSKIVNTNYPIKIKHFHMLWTNNTHVHSRCMLNCGILNYYLLLFSLQAVWPDFSVSVI
jgi:hypothetical protein